MTYKLKFDRKAKKAFDKLGEPVKSQFKAKLREVLTNPHIVGSALRGRLSGCYKLKLKSSGYRLVYKVEDGELTILVLAIGKRERNEAYLKAEQSIARN
ncbi:addiction module toxin RelE (plasmid) [Vibrio azureus]|uniref:Putative toxin-antitoxin system toxin component n=1 Tax=Vibrio azureus NBRC 104587 TaxID=1219077 RepID=U3AR50_9VIBR|nr:MULTISPECIES: type II toxin-antitoxin system RelE/ParE family toxin [Vibrio harveyi group]AUI88960.1 addiction module toxin RelE [Vibrio azureus]UMM07013.1 type II toxin-antitoxin system RelE/ParE family toxin [Vibrio campbellii]UMM07090.1 type II toxin-antitoxin system RelE/ParE family toxin [Vibrio campbellii]GAD76225.1 putative toxin-antitoxin system toxin component [Vibrio azureus NBRC 104587]